MEPAEPEKLLEAFHVLDPENRGWLTKDYLSKLMMEEGEQFTQEELDEMMAVAVDPLTGNIPYEFYLNQLMVIIIIIILYLCPDCIYVHGTLSTNLKIQFTRLPIEFKQKNSNQQNLLEYQEFPNLKLNETNVFLFFVI